MTERKRRMRTTNKERLERAGFEFEQMDNGKTRVHLPIKREFEPDKKVTLPPYVHLTTAVSAGMREIERVRVRKNAYGDLDEDWDRALAKFDDAS